MIRILMLGGTGAIGKSILSIIGNDSRFNITVTSRKERKSDYSNVQYICGNANDLSFINNFDDNSFDVLIDFMNYRNEILEKNFSKLIDIAKQYIFLSSARVYDNLSPIITEQSSLLLNTTQDSEFKQSGTYAIKKAYQETYVKENGRNKVTIIRPYKTYSSERLQLGEYEIIHWLRRLINNKPIVLNYKLLDKFTSLTYGGDVAKGIVGLIGNDKAFGETFQIVTDEHMRWRDVLTLYCDVLIQNSFAPVIYLSDATTAIDKLFESGYQMPYDILFDRKFVSTKISKIISISYKSMEDGLRGALSTYLENNTQTDYVFTEYDDIVNQIIEEQQLVLWRNE